MDGPGPSTPEPPAPTAEPALSTCPPAWHRPLARTQSQALPPYCLSEPGDLGGPGRPQPTPQRLVAGAATACTSPAQRGSLGPPQCADGEKQLIEEAERPHSQEEA